MSDYSRSKVKQAGMVAILVTMLLMIVISLIVLGFAQISRRNSRNALDRQLSTQAFYAAETGINDVRKLIDDAAAGGSQVPTKDDCTNGSGASAAFYGNLPSPTLDAGNQVSYTCVMVDPTPPNLEYGSVGMTSTVVPLNATSGTIGRLTITWGQPNAVTTTPTSGCPASLANAFSDTNGWICGYGVLRIDLVPTAGAGLTISTLQSTTMTSFLVPFSSGGTTEYSYATTGANNAKGVSCDDSSCSVTINSLNSSQYYLRLSSIYKNSRVTLSVADAAASPLTVQGAQAIIDATGKAQDVLRRVQVRVPLTASSTNLLSDYALLTTDAICKRFASMGTLATDSYFQSYAKAQVPSLTSSNPFCQ